MQHGFRDHATPTARRAETAYPARQLYRPGPVFPPAAPHVLDAIDLRVHCDTGQQDPLALAQFASQSGMRGIVFATIRRDAGPYRPVEDTASVREELLRWAADRNVRPVDCWPGYVVGLERKPPSVEEVRAALAGGARAIWLPTHAHANTSYHVGVPGSTVDQAAGPRTHTGPLPWEEARKIGHFLLDDQGHLLPVYREIVERVADAEAALFFGHATHPEIDELAALVSRLGFRRAAIDAPFSPFVDLTVAMLRDLAGVGIRFAFSFEELSPLLGVDPYEMYQTIRAVGVEHVMLVGGGGDPLLPNSVECVRLIRAYMAAFGATDDELRRLCTETPAAFLGLGSPAAGTRN